jgi:ribosome recycling factor
VLHIYCTITLVCFRVTKEHRENLAKNAKALFIKCRDSIRDVQNKYVKTVKNNSTISQDLSHNIQDQVSHICVNWTRSAEKSGVELLKEIHTFLGVHTISCAGNMETSYSN